MCTPIIQTRKIRYYTEWRAALPGKRRRLIGQVDSTPGQNCVREWFNVLKLLEGCSDAGRSYTSKKLFVRGNINTKDRDAPYKIISILKAYILLNLYYSIINLSSCLAIALLTPKFFILQ
jgi:hypothetical protein